MKTSHLVIITLVIIATSMVTFVLNSYLNTPPPLTSQNSGTLSGNVIRSGGPKLENSEANYEVDVYAVDGITLVGKTFSDANAHYSMQLPAGNYTIYAPNYPDKQTYFVSVSQGKNTVFNIAYGSGYK
jgi:hypothetical protein